ncbi:glutathione-specific gamma-glutamylcyclotransferase 1-like [Glandiceps talaboti]
MLLENNLTQSDMFLETSLWIFGYGSLTWNPNFIYTSRADGHIDGLVRRFWQGNVTHRGVPGAPGRVATLVKSNKGKTWGTAYEVRGEKEIIGALKHLNVRECRLGGYESRFIKFHPTDGTEPFLTLVFTATPHNALYMGPAAMATMAGEIASAKGHSGLNCEYVFKLAEYMRTTFPEVADHHLFELESLVRHFVKADDCTNCNKLQTAVNEDEFMNCHHCQGHIQERNLQVLHREVYSPAHHVIVNL